jgi:hypothetical protein
LERITTGDNVTKVAGEIWLRVLDAVARSATAGREGSG